MSDKGMDMKHCLGCEQDFYNDKNPLGVKRCWNLDTAKLLQRKEVPITQVPPWKQAARELPSCYQRRGYIYVKPDRER